MIDYSDRLKNSGLSHGSGLKRGGGGIMYGSGKKGGLRHGPCSKGGGGVLCTGQVKKGVTYLPVLDIYIPPPPPPGANIFFSDRVKTWSRQGRVMRGGGGPIFMNY